MSTSLITLILVISTLLLIFLITRISGNISIKMLDIKGRHKRRKISYYLSYWCILIGGTIVLYQFGLPAWGVFLLPLVVALLVGILYFRTRSRKYLLEPIVFGFFLLIFLIVSGAILFALRTFLFEPVAIGGESMMPNYEKDDVALVVRAPEYKRGDVILYTHKGQDFVKRIVGVPGEVIRFKGGFVDICTPEDKTCAPLVEEYLPAGTATNAQCDTQAFKIDTGYFVLGDNRANSTDSRSYLDGDCETKASYLVGASQLKGKIAYRIPHQYMKFMSSIFNF